LSFNRGLPCLVAAALISAGCSKGTNDPAPENRIRQLEQQVEQERLTSKDAVDSYVPKLHGRIDDLSAPAAAILRQLPGVADVEVLVAGRKPTRRIVHLRDWHLVTRDLHALDLRQPAGKPLSDARPADFLVLFKGLSRCLY
jgi:hypothetical protein